MNDFLLKAIKNQKTRRELTRHSIKAYMSVYFHEEMEYDFAPFHQTFFDACERTDLSYVIVSAFRESAKTTIFTTCFPLWAVMGVQAIKFVLIVANTKDQAERYLKNIRMVLEAEGLLKSDLGPFKVKENGRGDIWTSTDIDLSYYGARITIISQNQGYRGIKYGSHRPQLIICDDLEDINSVRSQEMRDKMYRKIQSDLMPAGHNQKTRFFFVGNLIHEDSYLLRLKKNLVDKGTDGIFIKVPLLDKNGKSRWPEKFPDNRMEHLRLRVGGTLIFNSEYLLIPGSAFDMIVKPEWIKKYKKLPDEKQHTLYELVISVDPAFSMRKEADFTAIVAAYVYVVDNKFQIHVLPHYFERRTNITEAIRLIHWLLNKYDKGHKLDARIIIESNGPQELFAQNVEMAIQSLSNAYVYREKNFMDDKSSRLQAATYPMEKGHVYFPMKYARPIRQLVDFHTGLRHDDLADAISMMINVIRFQYKLYDGGQPMDNLIRFKPGY